MSYTAEPKQQDTNIKVPLISKIAYGISCAGIAGCKGCLLPERCGRRASSHL